MAACNFCGKDIKKGSGKIFVKDNGQVLNFCSMKCEKNMLVLKRDARKFKWTSFFVKGEEPAVKTKAAKKSTEKKTSK